MSFIAKGIDMPKDTEGISVTFHTADGWMETHIFDANQVIQIPKGHGRIGDLGKLAKLISAFGESLKEYARGNRLLMTERDICYAIAVLTKHFQEYEPLLEAEE